MIENIIYIDEFMYDKEIAYLKYGNDQYLKICEKLYGVNPENLSIYFWTLYLIDLFKENIEEKCENIDNIKLISEKIVKLLKEDRKRIVLYGYTQGYIRGYKDSTLTQEFKKICEQVLEDKKRKSIPIGLLMGSKRIHNYHEFIKQRLLSTEDINYLIRNIKICCSKNIWNNINMIKYNFDKNQMNDIVMEILIKDVMKKYNDGVWDGVIYKIAKKTWKNDKITL